jgi:meso-butanediol dehydrogenase / (S,S)-butanediol dehydrogenase / diacetyl reductase
MSGLQGQVVLVTGAGRGTGRASAERCAAEGAAVALAGRSVAALEDVAEQVERADVRSLVVPTDVQDSGSISTAVARVEAELGAVDVLVANSGVAGPTAPLWEVTPEEWDATHAVNVRGVFLCCRAVLPSMLSRRSGAVVVIGSMSGKRPLANRTPYASSKTALIGLVRSLALETGPHGVRVNLVSPGPVTGPRLDRVLEAQSHAGGRPVADLRADVASESPLRHLVDPGDVAAAVVFLAGDGARSITGEDVNVSAGITMH